MMLNNGNYVEEAKNAILSIQKKYGKTTLNEITSTKIRSILSMTAAIYNDVITLQEDELNDDICGQIQYLKLRIIYEVGRDKDSNNKSKVHPMIVFIDETKILQHLEEVGKSKSQYIIFSRYMEALVAYRKYYGDRDK